MNIKFGDRRIIGQQKAKEHIERILSSDRISHAYLISGPEGVGKTAFALAFAEAINGIENLSTLGDQTISKKSSWFTHPDIHAFIPVPSKVNPMEVRERLELLAKDPYDVVSFSQRPALDEESSKNKQAFYPIDYFREDIRPLTKLKPNEGKRIVIILTLVETMRKEAANAFLKILEEPNDRLMFIFTTESYESLLPTITSRCHHIPLGALRDEEVKNGLVQLDGMNEEEAAYLARISGGNYAMTRFYNIEQLREDRESVINYLRMAFSQDAVELNKIIQDWQSSHNIEGLIALTNLIEMYIRDLLVYRATENSKLVANVDMLESVQKFVQALKEARLEEMIQHLDSFRPMLKQNVNPKIIFTVLAFRFSSLMRGLNPVIPKEENHNHLPAFVS